MDRAFKPGPLDSKVSGNSWGRLLDQEVLQFGGAIHAVNQGVDYGLVRVVISCFRDMACL